MMKFGQPHTAYPPPGAASDYEGTIKPKAPPLSGTALHITAKPPENPGTSRRTALIEHLKQLNHDGKQQLLRPVSRVTGA
jgi:hypothetical protein